tara:strand:+ start:771 stop:1856 length:1086 start_codon:yes stop_codon:yes gene_type:complete
MNSIFEKNKEDLKDFIMDKGEKSYRADQIWRSMYVDLYDDFNDISTIPDNLKKHLKSELDYSPLKLVVKKKSKDKSTDKFLWKLHDNKLIETVLMRYDEDGHRRKRRTVCISSQVGCALDCKFCATGQQGFTRQLSVGEIVSQVVEAKKELLKENPSTIKDQNNLNIVFMGMGEPLANYDRVIEAIKILNDQKGLNIGARNITVSTVGLLPKIIQLSKEKIQVNLAVSIHAPDNETRSQTVPINNKYPLEDLIETCKKYIEETNRKIFFEYVLLSGQNDSLDHANKLGKLLRPLLCHLNLIPVNPTKNSDYGRSNFDNIKRFRKIISDYGVPSTIRMEKGIDINAGCGQLKSEFIYMENLK